MFLNFTELNSDLAEMVNDDFDYPTIRDFFEERENCGCNVLDEGDSAKEIQKKNEKLTEGKVEVKQDDLTKKT